ncbi:MAG: DEAD/DEAH box helicase [Marinilabiliales bacterium]|nr:MAG: DEAD/DEAH box helicase [Marinilabiliales bacterium]
MTFKELEIIEPILRAVKEEGYTQPTPIQEQSIPILLQKKDLLGCAQTGTGKTAAFAIPILQHLFNNKNENKGRRKIKALIITPTRELAIQIGESFSTYGKYTALKNLVVFGGVNQNPQTNTLKGGVDILVATPGRLLDLMQQGFISLKDIEYFVLDEADHMLDMGFIHDIKKIIEKLPQKRHSLFFSATMPPAILKLSGAILGNPQKVTINPGQTTAEKVDQAVYYVSKKNKIKLLKHLLEQMDIDSVLVFSRTKHGSNKIVKLLDKENVKAEAIHGNKSQQARQKALNNFKEGITKVLVATDIAARGIDVEAMSHVVNYDLPNVSETYVHRIGRTARAGKSGIAISFCDGEERAFLKDIEKLIGQKITLIEDHPFPDDGVVEQPTKTQQNQRPRGEKSNNFRRNTNNTKKPYKSSKKKFFQKKKSD